jgi:hypothetical protein
MGVSVALREHVRKRDYWKYMAMGAANGATGGYAKKLTNFKVWMPAKIKILVHHIKRDSTFLKHPHL